MESERKRLQNRKQIAIIILTGVWRSLVARTAGGREVAGSNPVAPIEDRKIKGFQTFRNWRYLLLLLPFVLPFYGLTKKIRRKSCTSDKKKQDKNTMKYNLITEYV